MCRTFLNWLKNLKRVWVFRTGANALAKNQMRLAYEDKRDLYCMYTGQNARPTYGYRSCDGRNGEYISLLRLVTCEVPASRNACRCIWIQTPNVGELLPASYLAQWAPWRMCAVLLYEDQFVAVVRQNICGGIRMKFVNDWESSLRSSTISWSYRPNCRRRSGLSQALDHHLLLCRLLPLLTNTWACISNCALWRCSCACKTAALYCSASLTRHCIIQEQEWDQEWGLSQGHLYLYSTVLSVPVLYLSCDSSLLLLYLSCTYSEFIRYSSGFHGLSAG